MWTWPRSAAWIADRQRGRPSLLYLYNRQPFSPPGTSRKKTLKILAKSPCIPEHYELYFPCWQKRTRETKQGNERWILTKQRHISVISPSARNVPSTPQATRGSTG